MKDHGPHIVRETAPKHKKEDNLLTYDDYLRMPAGLRYELAEGELRMTPSPSILHQTVSKRLGRAFMEQLEDRGLGRVFLAPCDVVLSEHNVVQPDIFFISRNRLGIIGKPNVQGAPDLVVEILSESSEVWDRVTKRRIYALYGVSEYWIVDPRTHTVEVLTRKSGTLAVSGLYCAGQSVLSPLFPNLAIEVEALFAE
ncbi:MAG: Uma2 family endonuclease [Bacillota bacterium]